MTDRNYCFVTGRLAEQSLRRVIEPLSRELGFAYSVEVLPITVAALMTPEWIARHLAVPPDATHILLPGYCDGDLDRIEAMCGGRSLDCGPRDLRRLPQYFGQNSSDHGYGDYRIEIIAEINHCPRLSLSEIVSRANLLRDDGADVIDVGCDPGGPWAGVGDTVRALRDAGHRVSIDSLDPREISPAVAAGAELVLSVNSTNRDPAVDWGVEVVAIPDDPRSLDGLDATVNWLAKRSVPLRIDPILEPIGFGFGESLLRYAHTRDRYPVATMMMGIGNLTELTEVDSAGVNLLLLALCEEWGIQSVLTTQVINWARSSVRECDLARRLVHASLSNGVLPKHIDDRLLIARDDAVFEPTSAELNQLAASIRDNDYRVFAIDGQIHLVGRGVHWHSEDPFAIVQQMLATENDGTKRKPLDASHAFYLGYEMHKALTAITLGKNYVQDESLRWGHLTRDENRHYLQRRRGVTDDEATGA